MTKIMAIRKEFGEPFRDVVAGFALMGYSRNATAEILGITRYMITTYAPDVQWKPIKDMLPECKGPGWQTGRTKVVPQKYMDSELLEQVAKYSTYRTFDHRAPMSASIVVKRFGSWKRARRLAKEAA